MQLCPKCRLSSDEFFWYLNWTGNIGGHFKERYMQFEETVWSLTESIKISMHENIFPNIALVEEPLKNLFLLGEILAAMLKYWLLTVARFAVYIEIHVEMAFCMRSWLYYWLSMYCCLLLLIQVSQLWKK